MLFVVLVVQMSISALLAALRKKGFDDLMAVRFKPKNKNQEQVICCLLLGTWLGCRLVLYYICNFTLI